jgi:DNA helicase-2/ATP-dependent DNA helicase PcrA
VLVDEYQDTNRAQYRIIRQLTSEHRNICVVGDPDQCVVEGTLIETPQGAKPVETVKEGDLVIAASGWGSRDAAHVEAVRRTDFEGVIVKIRTDDGRELWATPNHMLFGRLDPDSAKFYVYLMYREGLGYRVGLTKGEAGDRLWILAMCDSRAEANYLEAYFAARYGLPTMVFHGRGRRMAMTQTHVDRLFSDIDTELRAKQLMADLRIFPDYPHRRAGAMTRRGISRKIVHFTMFGDPRPHRWHEHRIQLVSSDETLREPIGRVMRARAGKRRTWRVETSRKDHDAGMKLASDLAEAVSRLRAERD